MDTLGLETLLAVTLVAAVAPMVVAALPGPRIPQVVILILAGILIGPHGLGLADTASIRLLANVGLGFLFLLAGYELDPLLLRERPGRLAIGGWALSAVITDERAAGTAARIAGSRTPMRELIRPAQERRARRQPPPMPNHHRGRAGREPPGHAAGQAE